MPLKIALVGARGRMGRTIARTAREAGHTIVAEIDAGDDLAGGLALGQVIIDFSSPQATAEVIRQAAALRRPLVIGTTGHGAEERARLRQEAARIPCVWAGNYSVGVNLLYALVRRAAHSLPPEYDVEITEMHHRFKKDAPSGTAARLLEIVLAERGLKADAARYGRHGDTGERQLGEVGMHSLRGGDVVGDHTVMFASIGERIELTHRASDRAIFALGALYAASWALNQPPGVYDMQDVLGLMCGG